MAALAGIAGIRPGAPAGALTFGASITVDTECCVRSSSGGGGEGAWPWRVAAPTLRVALAMAMDCERWYWPNSGVLECLPPTRAPLIPHALKVKLAGAASRGVQRSKSCES